MIISKKGKSGFTANDLRRFPNERFDRFHQKIRRSASYRVIIRTNSVLVKMQIDYTCLIIIKFNKYEVKKKKTFNR